MTRWRRNTETARARRSKSTRCSRSRHRSAAAVGARTLASLLAEQRQCLFHAVDGNYPRAVNDLLGFIEVRYNERLEAKLGGFPDPLLAALNGTDLACQANFTKHQSFLRYRFVFQ